jgi:transposase InsO family protein
MQPHEVPELPWAKVGVDLFTLDGKDYLTMVDYYSQFIEVRSMTSTTSKAAINAMKPFFARHGTPIEVISDNGPQFSSQEFADFAKQWDFKHTTSSPHYPQSNGQAENAVKIMKNMIRKVKDSGEDIFQALQIYRSSPLEHGRSPAELMFNRRIRSNLPMTEILLKTLPDISSSFKKKQKELKQRQLDNYNKTTSVLPPLKTGDSVRVQTMDKPTTKPLWSQKGLILEVLPNRSCRY